MTYLQQQACLFIIAAIVIPIATLMNFVKEKEQNHIAFILLTPLNHHQIILGLLLQNIITLFLGIILHLPITLLCFFINNVEASYIILTTIDLLITSLFFSIIIFLLWYEMLLSFSYSKNMFRLKTYKKMLSSLLQNTKTITKKESFIDKHYRGKGWAIYLTIIIFIEFAFIQEFFLNVSKEVLFPPIIEQNFIRINPLGIMSRQGILLSNIRIQESYKVITDFLAYYQKSFTKSRIMIDYKADNRYGYASLPYRVYFLLYKRVSIDYPLLDYMKYSSHTIQHAQGGVIWKSPFCYSSHVWYSCSS